MKNSYIGILDSGIGGLTIVKSLKKASPTLPIIYFGDTANLPYGDKIPTQIYNRVKKIIRFLHKKKCNTILIACFTASSLLDEAIYNYCSKNNIQLYDMITPLYPYIIASKKKKIGMIGTTLTITKNILAQKLSAINSTKQIATLATPQLATIIEQGKHSKKILTNYLTHKNLKNIEALILGCTHYHLISKKIATYYPKNFPVVETTNLVVEQILKQKQKKLIQNNIADQYIFSEHTTHLAYQVDKVLAKNTNINIYHL